MGRSLPEILDTPNQPDHNVRGWERAGSLAAGVVLVGKGVARGGIVGLLQVALGGAALVRGYTGHSKARELLERGRRDADQIRARLAEAGAELKALKDSAVAATETATVTGEDPKAPPLA
ncbi:MULTISPECIES: YgaP-like transmembrane domain [unclassified Pseudomonas]|uniref:YgaP-like transmembrane domain n=1 Tax=unclassified Pseudomonas TaxID=196821 RepID=UPI000BD416E9|nr:MULTISPECIES: YgaP-like transmembrane domain [unclassified Pseudomonas]PVZ13830.1 Protein of unknown function (DUF2892) [Pseudomonas sp. URIL14HWK12:I12]PVZ24136.1 Protein of unknown function (DUF2892) [Pseudomonas sp. URIL14HWK12:I10]PVZ33225.1 Protein of unknown function (DUF2892) [Pseudomonas sp. URIL14HWK12:I11]SNZ10786.1 Protein of unknown function [Pseudomonas sp. URIL14HWK12:I9]